MESAESIQGYTGPVSRSGQTIIKPGDSANYNCSVVNFYQGVHDRMAYTSLRPSFDRYFGLRDHCDRA